MRWDDVKVFLAVKREGNLKGAARFLSLDQTTVSRRLFGLEDTLGSRLFLRSNGKLLLTDTGKQLIPIAETMERMAVSFERRVKGTDALASGEVRVTTTDALAVDFL